jgi:hypothetical protein
MNNNEIHNVKDYYAFYRAPVIIRDDNGTVRSREIGRVFTEYKDKLVIIDGEDRKEHEYLIPKSKVDRYGDKQIYLNISSIQSLKEFEI